MRKGTLIVPLSRPVALLVGPLVFLIAAFAVYSGIVEHPFHHFDDPFYVSNNYFVHNGFTWEGVRWAFTTMDGGNWHPVTWLSHMFDVALYGHKPAGHYLSNILVHSVGAFLLAHLLRSLRLPPASAFLLALVWTVHPANVECVAWISERKTLLADFFIFGGLIQYLRWKRGGLPRDYVLCVCLALLAAMSKPIAVLFPVALVLIDYLVDDDWFSGPTDGDAVLSLRDGRLVQFVTGGIRSVRRNLLFVAIAGGLSVVTFLAQDGSGATNRLNPFLWRFGNSIQSIFDYSAKALSMPNSSVLYVLAPLKPARICLGAALVVVFVLLIVRHLRTCKGVAWGLMWFFLMFLPTIGLVQVGSQRIADRYLGFPLIGMLFVVILGAPSLFPRRRALPLVLLGLWGVVLGLQARALCLNWSDALKLNTNAMRYGGASVSMMMNAAAESVIRGKIEAARRFAQRIDDDDKAILNLAIMDFKEERYEDALTKLQPLRANPKYAIMANYAAGLSLQKLSRNEEAVAAISAAIRALPAKRTWQLNIEDMRDSLPVLEGVLRQSMVETDGGSKHPASPDAESLGVLSGRVGPAN